MHTILRRVLSAALVLTLLVTCTVAGLVLPTAAETEKTILDLTGATVTASGAHTSYPAGNLIDGKTTTFWSSDPNTYTQATNEWVQVQLPYASFVDEVRLFPRYQTVSGVDYRRCFPLDFTIQVSADGVNWTTVVTETDYQTTGAEWQVFTFEQQTAVQYIKVDATKLYTENETAAALSYRCQFMELEAYYTPLSSVAGYAAAIDAVAIDQENSCLLYPSIPGITTTLKSTTDTDVVELDGTVDTVNSGNCEVVLTLTDGTDTVDTAAIPVSITGVADMTSQKLTISAASASSEANSQWTAARLINGSTTESNTGWSTGEYKAVAVPTNDDGVEWAMLTLAEGAIVKQVNIYPRNRTTFCGMPNDFEIQVSTDGVTWTTAYAANDYPMETYNAMQAIEITPTYGSYVRLWCTELRESSTGWYAVQLAEMEVYGVPASVESAADAAADLTVKPIATGDTAVDWEGVSKKYFKVTLTESSHPSVVALDGSITLPEVKTEVTLTLTVQSRLNKADSATVTRTVTVNSTYGLLAEEAAASIDLLPVPATDATVMPMPVPAVDNAAEFTVWHADMRPLFPSMTNQRWRDDRRAEDTLGMKSYAGYDVIDELLDALEPYGIDLHLYTHPSDGHDLTAEDQELTGWNDSTNQYGTWNDYVNELYYELVERYGDRIKGLWFDGYYNHVGIGDPQQRLHDTCLTFNPAMALVMNTGFDQLVDPAANFNGAEYRAWEIQTTGLETLKVSHNQSCMTLGDSWFTTVSQDTALTTVRNSAESIYRYTALMSTISTHGGFAASLAVYPEREGESLDNLWEYGIYDAMIAANDKYLSGVSESVKNVIPSTAYPTAEESTLATLEWGAASESADGETMHWHCPVLFSRSNIIKANFSPCWRITPTTS